MTDDQWSNQRKPELCNIVLDYNVCIARCSFYQRIYIYPYHRDRVGISKTELVSMLEEEELKDAVLVVLANKQVSLGKIFFQRVNNLFDRTLRVR